MTCREISEAEAGCLIRSLFETSHLKRDVIRHPASASEVSRQVKLSAHDCSRPLTLQKFWSRMIPMPMKFFLFLFIYSLFCKFFLAMDDADADGCAGVWLLTSSQTVGGVFSLSLSFPTCFPTPSRPSARPSARPSSQPPARTPQGADH